MACRVVWGAVLPAFPHDAGLGAADGAQRAGVVVTAGAGLGVEVLRPGVPVAGAVSQRVERLAQPLVTAPAERRGLAFAGLFGYRGLAGVAGERVAGWVAGAAVADLLESAVRIPTRSSRPRVSARSALV